ncbi:MAG TPA: cytidylate kinase family protein [Thermoplasmata archaeon]|nr:cytidylate kinase family protein [Thermoplasmata archaeon]
MISRVVVLSGPPGSGKSTAGHRVAAALGLEFRSAGALFRAEAQRHGLDLEAFGHFAEAHPEIDRALDDAMQALARPGFVLDGRVQGALCRRRGVPVYEVLVTADEDARVRRVAHRDGQSVDEARRRIADREASERARYRRFYGIDLDRPGADLTVDSTRSPPEEVTRTIVDFLTAREAGRTP